MARIVPRTRLRAGPSTVSGSITATHDGTGTLETEAVAVAGAGERIISGTGALQAQSAEVEGSSQGGGQAGEEITSFSLTSTSTGTMPFQVGHAFAEGDVPSGQSIVSDTTGVTLRAVVKRRWNDGSVKHAVLCGTAALTADTAKSIALQTGTDASGTDLTASDIQTAAPSASVQCGAVGTVSLGDLLASPFRTWISTPEMVECHYRSAVGADDDLVAWFYVRLFSDDRVHVRVAVENGYLQGSPTDRTYTATVNIGGSEAFSDSLTHEEHTRWDVDGWIGSDPAVTPAHNVQYLIDTKLVPNYWKREPASATLDALDQSYSPMQLDPHPTSGGSGGFAIHIGQLPKWDSLYVTTADERAYDAVITASRALGTYSVIRRHTNNLIAKPTDAASYAISGGTFNIGNTAGTIELNHLQNTGFLAYLITGEFFHYETMALLTSLCYFAHRTSTGTGTSKVLQLETRGTGENLRLLGHYCAIAPLVDVDEDDEDVVTEYRSLMATQATHWKGQTEVAGMNQLGTLYQYSTGAWGGDGTVASWMNNYWVGAMGQVSNMEPLADMSDWNTARDWMYKWPVGLAGTLGNFCYTHGGGRNGIVVDPTASGTDFGPDETDFYDDWGDVWTATFGSENTVCALGSALDGDGTGASNDPARAAVNHRWGVFIQALSYAKEHGATGADDAWTRITGSSSWPDVEAGESAPANFNDTPIWGIIPRGWLGTSELAQAAASLSSGQSTKLGTFSSDLVYPDGTDSAITDWASSAVWDRHRKEIRYIGKRSGPNHHHILRYQEDTHAWDLNGISRHSDFTSNSSGHGYDGNTVDPATGDHYFRRYNTEELYHWDASAESWSKLPSYSASSSIVTAIAWVPRLGIVHCGDIEIEYYDGSSWTSLGSSPVTNGTYHLVAEYNETADVLLFGAGNGDSTLWKLDSANSISEIATPPFNTGSAETQGLLVTLPGTSKFLAYDKNGTFQEYDASANSWSAVSRSTGDGSSAQNGAPNITGDSVTGTPIDTYGVVMMTETGSAGSPVDVWLYKP